MTSNLYNSPWTAERTEIAKSMWAAGHSASEIAVRLACGLSRNSVIGKINRLNQPKRATVVRVKGKRIKRMVPTKPVIAKSPTAPPEFDADLPPDQSSCAVTIEQLTYRHCRFPIEQPTGPMMYCGAVHVEGSSWCPRHFRIVHLPAPARKPQSYWNSHGKAA